MTKKKSKKRLVFTILITACLFSILMFHVFYKDIPIEKEYICQKNFQANDQSPETIVIKVEGVYKRQFLKEDYFVVKLDIDGKPYPDTDNKMILPFQHNVYIYNSLEGYQFTGADTAYGRVQLTDGGNLRAFLMYTYLNPSSYHTTDKLYHETIGDIVFSKDFSKIALHIWSTEEFIVSGRTSKEATKNVQLLKN